MQKIITNQTNQIIQTNQNNQSNQNSQNTITKSDLTLINRQRLTLTGITNVSSYSENVIVAILLDTKITIRGTKLNIQKLDVENGILETSGMVDSIVYGKSNILKRLFK